MEIADIREKSAKRKQESQNTLEPANNEFNRKKFFEEKSYLECDREDQKGGLKINLFLPPYDIESI